MSKSLLVLLYVTFAGIATGVNLLVQRLVLAAGPEGGPLPPALLSAGMAAGTVAGLAVKYALDKRWIFANAEGGAVRHGRKFALYSVMGLATTAIFWGMEGAFWLIWRSEAMRELGAVIGLGLGYAVKYRLDRRFVFADGRAA